jgi:translocation and assembly module TamB
MVATLHRRRDGGFGEEAASALRSPVRVSKGGRGMRALKWTGGLLGTLAVFVVSLVLGVVLHANTPAARRLAMSEVNALLAPSFQGRIRIEHLGGLGLLGVSDANVSIDDPGGRPVLVAHGIRVRVATLAAVRSALFGTRDPLTVELSEVTIDAVEARLDSDPQGQLDLVDAFAPRTTAPPSPTDANARGFRITLPLVTLGHVWAHGLVAGAPPIDADVDDFRGSFSYSPDVLEGDVSRAKVVARRAANGADVIGLLEGYVEVPSAPDSPIDARITWEGIAAGLEHSVHASFIDHRIDAVVDVPLVEPASVRSVWAASPIENPGRAHAEAHGTLTDLDVRTRLELGEGTLTATGNLSLATHKTARIAIDARDIDVHQIVAAAPTTRVGLSGNVSADMAPDGAITGEAALRFLGGRVDRNRVPAASIRASGSLSATRQVRASASVAVDEPGAPTQLDVEVVPKGGSSEVDFDLRATSADLDRVPELQHALRGSVRLSATGAIDAGSRTVDARIRAAGDGIARGTTRVASASLDGHLEGELASPRVDVVFRALGVLAGGRRFDSVYVGASGSATAPQVRTSIRGPDTPDIDASADVALASVVSIDGLRLTLGRRGEHALVTVRKVDVGGGAVRVDDARVEGLGSPVTATFAATGGTLRVLASAEGIDLARAARLANLEKTLKGGTLAFDADLRLQPDRGQGRLTLDVMRASFGTVKEVSGHAQLTLDARRVGCKVHAEAGGIGSLDVDAPTIELASDALTSAAAWKDAWGAIDVDASADLAKLADLVPVEERPVSRARGKVHIKGHLSRSGARDFTPDLALTVQTDQLEIAGKTSVSRDIDGVLVFPPPAWHVEGIDFAIDGHIDGRTGALRLSARAHDAKGDLAQLDVASKHFPYAETIHDTATLFTRLRTTPFDAHLVIPERGLGGVPPILRQSYVAGRLRVEVKASGTMLVPDLSISAGLRGAEYAGPSGPRMPLDVDVAAHYDGARASASVKALSEGRDLLDFETQVDVAVAQLLGDGASASDASPAWKASAHAHLAGFPMGSIAALDDKLVAGQLSGDVSLVDLHANAHADAALTIDALSVGSVNYKSAIVRVKADGHMVDASVRIDQTDGFLDTKAHATASWGAAMAPVLDRGKPLDFNLSAKNFRIAALLPFVDGTLDELDGRLDAETRVTLDPTQNKAQASGTIALSRGTVEAVAGGGELHDITANVTLAPDGTITLKKLTAKGLTGQMEVTGTAKLDGASLQSAKAVIVIPSRSAVPVTVSGTEVGSIDGRIELSERTSASDKAMDIKVEVPQLRVALPEASSTDPQALGSMPKVRIGAHRGEPSTFVLLPIDPPAPKAVEPAKGGAARLTVETHFGDLQVVRGTELKVALDGRVNVVSAGNTPQVTGQVHLKRGGTLDVQGKRFTVEDGTVTLVGADPSNPEVVVKASWTAPDATVVYAVFNGPLKTGKVTLSSEPTLPQQEIVELLLFGTADGTQAQTPTGTPQSTAIGTAGGEAAQPLNHMLGQLGLGAVTANIDSTQAANPRPEVEVQIAKDISVQIAVVLGQPPPGVNPDHTLLTVDWRFLSKWSLASTVGDAGTTIFDLLWQRRY